MNILHYFLGFPPYARGGLTKYALDLMQTQQLSGNKVVALWPGQLKKIGGIPSVKQHRRQCNIQNYEIINPLPLSQIYGIREWEIFTTHADKEIFVSFLKTVRPDIIHLHTLMGLHAEWLSAAKELGIKTIFTSHDYFPLCPKTILNYNGAVCRDNIECNNCWNCCENALSVKKILLLQSPLYRLLKNNKLMVYVRKKSKAKMIDIGSANDLDRKDSKTKNSLQYKELRLFYINMLSSVSMLHFNSSYARELYSNYGVNGNGHVLNISHADIEDHKRKKHFDSTIRLTYVGAIAAYKGFYLLLNVLDKLYDDGYHNFELHVYESIQNDRNYLHAHAPYTYNELESVMENTDLLIVPQDVSFGFTVLEGLSYGCPVLISENVGAKDLIKNGVTGYVCKYTEADFTETLCRILDNISELSIINDNILKNTHITTIEEHCTDVINCIYNS